MSSLKSRASRLERLEREAAERIKPIRLAPPARTPSPASAARRAASITQLGAQLLHGLPAELGPYPSAGLHPRAADLFRRKARADAALANRPNTPFAHLEAHIAANPAVNGPRIFGADWPHVRPVFVPGAAAPKPKRAPLEATEQRAYRAARWAAYLASSDGHADIERGVLIPAQPAAPTGSNGASA